MRLRQSCEPDFCPTRRRCSTHRPRLTDGLRPLPSGARTVDGAHGWGDVLRHRQTCHRIVGTSVARHPNFVLAYCELAKWHDDLYLQRNHGPPEELTIDHRSLTEIALEKARTLQPDSGAVHLELADHALKITKNLEEAETQVELARRTLPNNSQVEAIAGRVARRQDQWEESIRCFERAVSLEPRDLSVRNFLALTYRYMRRYDDYDRAVQSMIALTPPEELDTLPVERALAQLEKSADLGPLRATITTQMAAHQLDDDDADTAQMMLALWSRDAAGVSSILSRMHGHARLERD